MEKGLEAETFKSRKQLKKYLNQIDFEYLTWIEWKEGFARVIENRIKSSLGIEENYSGKVKPHNRVSFYYSGAKLIEYLVGKEPALYVDIESLFNKMYNY